MKKILSSAIAHLSSLAFTLIILSALTLTVFITMLQDEIIALLGGYLPNRVQTIRTLFDFFAIIDRYHSWWFTTLLILFSANLLLCTVKRIPNTLRNLTPFNPDACSSLPPTHTHKESFTVSAPPLHCEHTVRYFLSRKISSPSICHRAGVSLFFSQRGGYAHVGFYLAHLGLLAILAGGMMGKASYKGDVCMRYGETIDTFCIRDHRDQFFKKLGFALRLDQGEVISGDTGAHSPKGSRGSTVTLLKEGKTVATGILGNHRTLKHSGIRIARLSSLPEDNCLVSLLVIPKEGGGEGTVYTLRNHEYVSVPETGHTIRIKNIYPLPVTAPREGLVKASAPFPRDSADAVSRYMVNLEVYGKNNRLLYAPFVLAGKSTYHHPWDRDYEFSLAAIEKGDPIPSARLEISFEPGGHLIWIGASAAIIGFITMFLFSHRKLWVAVEKRDGYCHVTMAGWVSRNPEVMEDLFKEMKQLTREEVIAENQ